MKSLFTSCLATTIIIFNCNAQILERNEVDEFTGNMVQKTSCETLVQNFKMVAFVSVMSVNDSTAFLELKLTIGPGRVHAIDRGGIFFIKLSDNSIIELQNSEYSLSCTGCGSKGLMGSGSQGTRTTYILNKSNINKLRKANATKIRVYTTNGYIESDVNNNKSDVIKRLLNLLSI